MISANDLIILWWIIWYIYVCIVFTWYLIN
jgi:hypothetical protein